MYRVPLEKPKPDFGEFNDVILGRKKPRRVHFFELHVDTEVRQFIFERYLGEEWVPPSPENLEMFQKQEGEFYYRMGYDYFPTGPDWLNFPEYRTRTGEDTAGLSRGQRVWVDEAGGIIKTWEDFERINWDAIRHDTRRLEYAEKYLHDGMMTSNCAVMFEMVLERFLGYEDLFILSVENPELVEAVFERWGQIVYRAYEEIVQRPKVGAIFHADDLGHRTGTLLGPEFLRKNVFPWFRKYAELTHSHGKPYWYHCCGNIAEVMEDLIEDVKIDALHSFQDLIMPIGDFMDKYGDRIGALGGIDMDNLGRMTEPELRNYVRKTIERCMPGRFCLGSGNSVANYIPPENYLAMLDEGMKWQ